MDYDSDGRRPNAGRRRFLKQAGSVALGGLLLGGRALAASTTHAIPPAEATPAFKPDVEMELAAVVDQVSLLPGAPTAVWRFTGKVLRGNTDALSFLKSADDGPSLVPVIRIRRGQKVRIFFTNRLPEQSIVHWHGLHIVQRMDGHPMYAIGTGKRYVYEFIVDNRAGTCWFHPHPHERTGFQVYHGLAGFFLVGDDEEDAAQLPRGAFDLPLVIQDRTFDSRNQLVYLQNMMERMMGFMGERILVNAKPDYIRPVERTAYRLRLLNGSNSTAYRLSLNNGQPFWVIGTDGGLLEQAMTRRTLTLGVGERADVWLDFAAAQSGEDVALVAQPFAPMMLDGGAMPMMRRPANTAVRPIARFRVGSGAAKKSSTPARLSKFPAIDLREAVNRERPRRIQMSMMRGQMLLNGRTFDMESVSEDERVMLGTTEVWEFVNDSPMAHPMHVHNLHFRVIERSSVTSTAGDPNGLSAGFTDEGLKDIVLVLPGQRVQVLMKFEDHTGLYLYHCHILEHEDLGMMRNYRVEAKRA
jgi:FtsP/CotA-like multicopper oxidase with cupredoxin domain